MSGRAQSRPFSKSENMYPEITNIIKGLQTDSISEARKQVLHELVEVIQTKVNSNQDINLNFICTHNSRRSHLSQVWAQTLAYHFNIKNVFTYSGGTEATALFPVVAETLENLGFSITKLSNESNPVYSITYANNAHPIIGFSKTFDNDFNPKSNFAAIMTCSSADEGCPFVSGSDKRIAMTFEDPKVFDDTPIQKEKYLERSLQIATELKYVFSSIKNKSA